MNGLYLQEIMQFNTSSEGIVGPSDQTTPCTPHTAPFFSTEKLTTRSTTPLRPVEDAAAADRRTPDRTEDKVEADSDTNADAEVVFHGSSRVTSMGSIVTTFLVNDEIVPIKIEKIPGNYRLFNLSFILCL